MLTVADRDECECDDEYIEQALTNTNRNVINAHPAGHHLVQTHQPNHDIPQSCSLIQNHQATIVTSANEHLMLGHTLSADDLINAVNRHRYVCTFASFPPRDILLLHLY